MYRLVALSVGLGLSGCGGEGKGPTAAPQSAPPSASGCAATAPSAAPSSAADIRPLKERLIGSWRVDLENIQSDAELRALPADKRKKALAMARQLLKDLRIEFGADGTVSVGAGEQRSTGTYTAVRSADDTLTAQAKMKGPSGAVQEETLTVQFVGEAILVTGVGGKAIRFRK